MKENDAWFLARVEDGTLLVLAEGKIINLKTGRTIGSRKNRRYATISMQDSVTKRIRSMLVHRLVYLVHVGDIPDGHEIDHGKEGRHCDAARNLEAVTHKANMARAWSDGRMSRFPKGNSAHKLRKTFGNRYGTFLRT